MQIVYNFFRSARTILPKVPANNILAIKKKLSPSGDFHKKKKMSKVWRFMKTYHNEVWATRRRQKPIRKRKTGLQTLPCLRNIISIVTCSTSQQQQGWCERPLLFIFAYLFSPYVYSHFLLFLILLDIFPYFPIC